MGRKRQRRGGGAERKANMFLILAIDKCCAHCAKISIKFLPDGVFQEVSKKKNKRIEKENQKSFAEELQMSLRN